MVGIPGSSKGCNTCRRRKVRCDLAKPHCERCTKTGRTCEGYERRPGPLRRKSVSHGSHKHRPSLPTPSLQSWNSAPISELDLEEISTRSESTWSDSPAYEFNRAALPTPTSSWHGSPSDSLSSATPSYMNSPWTGSNYQFPTYRQHSPAACRQLSRGNSLSSARSISEHSTGRPPLPTPPSSWEGKRSESTTEDNDDACSTPRLWSQTVKQTSPQQRPQLSIDTLKVDDDRRILHSFLDIYFPKDIIARHDPNHIWLQQAAFLTNPGTALRLSLRAISMVRVGFHYRDGPLVARGRETYVSALRELSNFLRDDTKMKEDRTLAACRVLTLYELFDSTSFRAWNKHQSGMSNLLQTVGPAAFTSPLGRSVIESFRGPAMFQSIQERHESFLAQPQWSAQMKGSQDSQQRLYDVGLDIAGFLEDFDQVSDSGAIWTESQTLHRYLSRCAELDTTLESFYSVLVRETAPMPLYWDGHAGPSHICQGLSSHSSAHKPLDFPTLTVAQTLMVHWALQLIVSMTIADMCNKARASQVMSTPSANTTMANTYMWTGNTTLINQISNEHDTSRIRQTAIQVTRSISYSTRDEQGLVGPQRCIFPIRIALTAFRLLNAEELSWCEDVYQSLADNKGLSYAKEILGFEGRWGALESSALADTSCEAAVLGV